MSKISAEAKVGVFVVIGMIILGYMSMKVGKFTFGRAAGYDVKVYFDSVSGLAEDVQVEVAGVEVGRVREISLENGKALVVLRINSNVMLTKDVKAVIRTKGILGDRYVELIPGSSAAPLIQDGGKIVYTVPTTDMDSLISTLGQVAANINELTSSLANVVGGKDGEASLRFILDNVKEMVEALNRTVQENNKDVSRIITNLSEFSETLNDIVSKVNKGKGSIGRLVNEDETIDNLNAALTSLKTITDKINNGEGSVGKLINEDETVENINTSLTSINNYLQKE